MPVFAEQNREQLRQAYVDAWRKHCQQLPLTPLEAQIADVIALHSEYHSLFNAPAPLLQRDWQPEGGMTNPFLHMGLHLAIREQVATDRPAGIRAAFAQVRQRHGDAHAAEHQLIDCLAEALWQAQRQQTAPDEAAYLARIQRLARG